MTDSHIVWPAVKWQEGEIEPILQYLRLPYLHQKQKSMSGWDFSAARRTRGEPFVRYVCR